MGRLLQAVMLLGCISLCAACRDEIETQNTSSAVQAAPIESVVALGRLEPDGEVIQLSVPNAQDSRVNQLLVKEGDYVQANQVIAILQGIDRRIADLQDAETDVRLRKAELAKVLQGDVKAAQIIAQQAAIHKLEAQLTAEKKRKQAMLASAKATLQEAELTYQRRLVLVQEGAINRAEVDAANRDRATSTATLTEREADLEQTITTLQAEINQEQAKLAELKEIQPVDVEIAQAHLAKAQIAVRQQQANLEDAKVRVPIAGRILRINTHVGEQVNTSQGIVELAQTSQMYAIAEVPETDIGAIRRGQQATITSEYGGFNGSVQGTVEQIGLKVGRKSLQAADAAAGPTIDQNARIVSVKVRIATSDNAKVASFTNMQVRVQISLK